MSADIFTEQVESQSLDIEISQTDIITICGRRGSGKSNLAKILMHFLISRHCPLLIVDPLQEHTEFVKYSQVHNRYIEWGDREAFDNLLAEIFKNRWKGIIVIDEADGYFPNRKNLSHLQKRLIHLGRHYGLGMIFITRRLANLHTDVISQTTKLYSFRLFAGADANYLELMQLGDLVQPIWSLEKYHFVYFDGNTGEMAVCQPLPKY